MQSSDVAELQRPKKDFKKKNSPYTMHLSNFPSKSSKKEKSSRGRGNISYGVSVRFGGRANDLSTGVSHTVEHTRDHVQLYSCKAALLQKLELT